MPSIENLVRIFPMQAIQTKGNEKELRMILALIKYCITPNYIHF